MEQGMTWQELLDARQIRPHQTSAEELFDLRAIIERDLADAKVTDISPDRRFATAYNAVLKTTKMVLACAGYRVVGTRPSSNYICRPRTRPGSDAVSV